MSDAIGAVGWKASGPLFGGREVKLTCAITATFYGG